MKGTCHCGKPLQTSLTYKFIAPTGYKSSSVIQTCESCGPAALRAAAAELQAWANVMDGTRRPPEPAENKDVHTEHCCSIHGCKYNDVDCPVVTGKKGQSHACPDCLQKQR